MFGPSPAASKRTLAAWQRARGVELIDIPESDAGTETRFGEYDLEPAGGLRARLRVSTMTMTTGRLQGQAFRALYGADAVVFVPAGKLDATARRAIQEHFDTYGERPVIVAAKRGPALVSAVELEVVAAFRARRIKGRPTTVPSKAYMTRATAIAEAARLAAELGPRSVRRHHESIVAMALHPKLGFATTSSLRSLEAILFHYWNEAPGSHVARFWSEIARRGLPFQPRDVLGEILARGRITNREDYDTVIDRYLDRRLTDQQRRRLSKMLGAYETARSGR